MQNSLTSVFYTEQEFLNDQKNNLFFLNTPNYQLTKKISRIAIIKALSQKSHTITSLDQLNLNDIYNLDNFPEYTLSLSHCPKMALTVIAEKKDLQAIGCDIEQSNRAIKAESARYFINENDNTDLSLLECWIAKEAAFKCHHKLTPESKVLKDIILFQNDSSTLTATNSKNQLMAQGLINKVTRYGQEYTYAIFAIEDKTALY